MTTNRYRLMTLDGRQVYTDGHGGLSLEKTTLFTMPCTSTDASDSGTNRSCVALLAADRLGTVCEWRKDGEVEYLNV